MKYALALAGVAVAATTVSLVVAHETDSPPGKRLSEMTWSKEVTYQWNRPDHVRWALIRACGGGGGGAGAFVTTTLLGPLTASSYTVVIGRGGAGGASRFATSATGAGTHDSAGQPGLATTFAGQDLSFETPGAVGGEVGHPGTRFSDVQNNYEYFVMGVPSTGDAYPGGGSSQNGARGLLGLGGAADQQGYSGGGGGSLGNGGAGGNVDQSGGDGGTCAGGGGAGFLRGKSGSSIGGHGGDGSLTLVSVMSPEQ
jgi:hypothetical protein